MKKKPKPTPKKGGYNAKILGVSLFSKSFDDLLERLTERISRRKKTLLLTPNPEFIIYAQRQAWFQNILTQATFNIADGVGLVWASRILGEPISQRITGVDLMEALCQEAAKSRWRVYFFGGSPGVARAAFAALKGKYPGLRGWIASGPKLDLDHWDQGEVDRWVRRINRRGADLLFVALGMGKQEKFLGENWKALNVNLAMGVGGAFNYLSGQAARPPAWIRNLGLEWLYRLIKEPRRWKRQLALLKFIWLVFKERFTG